MADTTPPRRYVLTPEPAADVTALREEPEGLVWLRHTSDDGRSWWYPAGGDPVEDGADWDELIAPTWPGGALVDVTSEFEEVRADG